MKGRVLVNAGASPYVAVKLRGQPSLDVLRETMGQFLAIEKEWKKLEKEGKQDAK